MELLSTGEFDRDFKKADKEAVDRIKRVLGALRRSNLVGKPLRHVRGAYSVRINNKRLVYRAEAGRITLLFFKSREDVYDYMR